MNRMKLALATTLVALMAVIGQANAQISFKTEHIGNSAYMYSPEDLEEPDVKVGDSQGSVVIYQGSANIPLYTKMNENNRLTTWGIGLSGSYASLDNKNFTDGMVSEIMNLQIGISHLRSLNDKLSMMASLGAGVYTPFTRFSKIRWKHLLGSGGVIFIWHLRPNLDLGGGLAVNNSLGYPMVFPALYLNWRLDSKFKVNVSMGEGIELSGGYAFNDCFKLSLSFEMNGQMALVEKEGKDMIFSHQYMVTGLRSEIEFGKTGLSMFAMGGINVVRPATYMGKTLKAMFAGDNDYYFRVSPYVSAGITYGF